MRGDTAADDDAAALESADCFGLLLDVDGAATLSTFKYFLLVLLNCCVSGAETLSTSLREVLALEALWGWVRAERFVPLSGGTSSFAVWAPSASGTCEKFGASCGITSATVRSKHATSSSFSFRLHGLPSNAFVHLIRSLFLKFARRLSSAEKIAPRHRRRPWFDCRNDTISLQILSTRPISVAGDDTPAVVDVLDGDAPAMTDDGLRGGMAVREASVLVAREEYKNLSYRHLQRARSAHIR